MKQMGIERSELPLRQVAGGAVGGFGVFVDRYSSVPVAVMVIKDSATKARVAGSGDLREASIVPIRFSGVAADAD